MTCVESWRKVEAHPDYWYRFVGLDGAVVGIDRFGVCGPGAAVMQTLGMTADRVEAAVHDVLNRSGG